MSARIPQPIVYTLLLAALAAACAGRRSTAPRPAPQGEGSVWVYVAPLSGEAGRLSFRLSGISAVSQDGEAIPLTLALPEVDGLAIRGERLLAYGALTRGAYVALRIRVESATFRGDQGEASLQTPDEPTQVDIAFSLRRGKTTAVLSLELPYDRAVSGRFQFTPAFVAAVPQQPAVGLTGLASCRGAGTVWFFDKVSGRTFAVVSVGRHPSGIAMTRSPRRAFVSISGENAVAVLGIPEYAVLQRVTLGAGDAPEELALTPDEETLLTANAGSATVSVIDVRGLVETDRIRVGDGPRSVQIDPSGRRAFVFNTFADTISVIEIARRTVVATLATDPEPLRGEFDREGARLYVIHRTSPHLTVLDVPGLALLRRVYVGYGATALAVDPNGRILLARAGTGQIDVYDPSSLLPLDFIRVGGDVRHLAIDEEGNNLHVALGRDDRVQILRLSSKKVLAEVDVGADPVWVAVMGER